MLGLFQEGRRGNLLTRLFDLGLVSWVEKDNLIFLGAHCCNTRIKAGQQADYYYRKEN